MQRSWYDDIHACTLINRIRFSRNVLHTHINDGYISHNTIFFRKIKLEIEGRKYHIEKKKSSTEVALICVG